MTENNLFPEDEIVIDLKERTAPSVCYLLSIADFLKIDDNVPDGYIVSNKGVTFPGDQFFKKCYDAQFLSGPNFLNTDLYYTIQEVVDSYQAAVRDMWKKKVPVSEGLNWTTSVAAMVYDDAQLPEDLRARYIDFRTVSGGLLFDGDLIQNVTLGTAVFCENEQYIWNGLFWTKLGV